MTESRKPKTEMVIQLLDSALWIFLCDETAVPENRKPIVRNIGNHLMLVYSRKLLSKPYTSRIDKSFDGAMLWMLIIYTSCTIRSRIASVKGLDAPPSLSYHPSFWYCEQKIVEDFLRLLWSSSKISFCSLSFSFKRSYSSMIRRSGLAYLAMTFLYVPSFLDISRSISRSRSRTYFDTGMLFSFKSELRFP